MGQNKSNHCWTPGYFGTLDTSQPSGSQFPQLHSEACSLHILAICGVKESSLSQGAGKF